MSDVINKTTKVIKFSISKSDLEPPAGDWIVVSRSDAEYLKTIQPQYIIFDNDVPKAMNQTEIDAYDVANPKQVYKTKMEILSEIWTVFTIIPGDDQATQDAKNILKLRLVIAMNKYGTFATVLEDFSYNIAREIMQMALAAGDILQSDYDMIDAILPVVI